MTISPTISKLPHVLFALLIIHGLTVHSNTSLGRFPRVIDLSQSNADVLIYGAFAADDGGRELATGDINGDDVVDLVILSPNASPLGREYVGRIDIVWGPVSPDSLIDLRDYPGVSRILGANGDDGLYSDIACADLDFDGYDDVIFGVPCENLFIHCDGKAYIVFGSPSFPDTLDLDNPTLSVTTIYGNFQGGGFLGTQLTTGDTNGDSYPDLVLGAPASIPGGQVFVVLGRDTFPEVIDLTSDATGVIRIVDPDLQQATGEGLACHDVDEDGYADILIGSPGSNPIDNDGKATLLYGSVDLPDTVYLSDDSIRMIHFAPVPEHTIGQLGHRVAFSDLNGDSHIDMILPAHTASPFGCSSCGEIYIVNWTDSLPDTVGLDSTDLAITRLIGAGIARNYGEQIIGGDVDGDGVGDAMIFSRYESGPSGQPFTITIAYGSSNFPDSVFLATDTTVTRILGGVDPDEFGSSMALDDFDGDGVNDLVAGAYAADPLGRGDAGEIYLFYGVRTPTNVVAHRVPILRLLQNYPNPFSSTTTIDYEIANPGNISVTIYNVLGQQVKKFERRHETEGLQSIIWDGRESDGLVIPSGIYFYRIKIGGTVETKKMVLIR